MKFSVIAVQKLFLLVLVMGLLLVALEGRESDEGELIGAKVFGPARLPVGEVVGVLRSPDDASALMYVVDANGIFNGRGIVPLSNVVDEMPRPRKGGEIGYDIEVTVNRATFKNLANWGRKESLESYLSRKGAILSTVYDLSLSELESIGERAVYDDGSEPSGGSEGLAGL